MDDLTLTLENERKKLVALQADLQTVESRHAAALAAQAAYDAAYIKYKVQGGKAPEEPADNVGHLQREARLLKDAVAQQRENAAKSEAAWKRHYTELAKVERQKIVERAVETLRKFMSTIFEDQKFLADCRKRGLELNEPMACPPGCDGWLQRWGAK